MKILSDNPFLQARNGEGNKKNKSQITCLESRKEVKNSFQARIDESCIYLEEESKVFQLESCDFSINSKCSELVHFSFEWKSFFYCFLLSYFFVGFIYTDWVQGICEIDHLRKSHHLRGALWYWDLYPFLIWLTGGFS